MSTAVAHPRMSQWHASSQESTERAGMLEISRQEEEQEWGNQNGREVSGGPRCRAAAPLPCVQKTSGLRKPGAAPPSLLSVAWRRCSAKL